MEKNRAPVASRLFQQSLIECRDEQEEKYERCYSSLLQAVQGKGEKEISDSLNMEAQRNHEDTCTGLLVGILTDKGNCIKYYSYLGFVAKDGLEFVVREMNKIMVEKYKMLTEPVQHQLIWLVRELVRSGIPGAEDVCWNTMRNIVGGNVNTRNLWLADQMMNIFTENKSWLYSSPHLISGVIFTFLRLLQDHVRPNLREFGEKEVNFVVQLIRERFINVLTLGRDFVRLLQAVARIPEIEEVWMDILFQPSKLSPQFIGIEQLLKARTPNEFLTSRITPNMELKLKFMTQNVRFGFHTRYESWFQRDFLASQESQTLRADIVRYVVSVIHPTNEQLQSAVTPRWALIGWILTSCTNQVISANVKLALFYDWICFNPPIDNIMSLEPAILVVSHSLGPHPQVTTTLLDFLVRLASNFLPSHARQVLESITASFKHVKDTGVISRLTPIMFNTCLSPSLRKSLRTTFEELYLSENPPIQKNIAVSQHASDTRDIPPISANPSDTMETVQFSDDEDNSDEDKLDVVQELSPPKKSLKTELSPIKVVAKTKLSSHADVDINLKKIMAKIESFSKVEVSQLSGLISEVMKNILIRPVFAEDSKLVAECLSENLSSEFEGKLFPQTPVTSTLLQDCLSMPIFSLFHCLTDPRRDSAMELLANLQFLQPRLGYCLLLFLTSSPEADISQEDKINLYTEFCQATASGCSLGDCLVRDLTGCQDDDVDLFIHLIPSLFRLFPNSTLGNVPLFYLIVSCVDGSQIQHLVFKIVSQQLILLHGDSCLAVMEASLDWETFEQYAFWNIYNAHELPIASIQNFLPKLSSKHHAEALTHVLFILKKKKANTEILSKCIKREPAGDDFLSTLCGFWMKYCPKLLTSAVAELVTKSISQDGTRKRKVDPRIRAQEKSSIMQVLGHFTPAMKNCKELFEDDAVVKSFQKLGESCLESTKLNHPEIFEFLASIHKKYDSEEDQQSQEDDDSQPINSNHRSTNFKKPRRKSTSVNYKEVDSTGSEDEEMPPKKKKKMFLKLK